jgi:hypothetical protein
VQVRAGSLLLQLMPPARGQQSVSQLAPGRRTECCSSQKVQRVPAAGGTVPGVKQGHVPALKEWAITLQAMADGHQNVSSLTCALLQGRSLCAPVVLRTMCAQVLRRSACYTALPCSVQNHKQQAKYTQLDAVELC